MHYVVWGELSYDRFGLFAVRICYLSPWLIVKLRSAESVSGSKS